MAFAFGDTFDLYATTADLTAGYWDSGSLAGTTIVAGRFAGSQCLNWNTASSIVKSSGQNDAVHHVVCAFRQTAALSGSTLGTYFQFSDGATNQCCIVFRSDGVILLTSATPGGTVLATYSGAVTAQNTWYGFEFEVTVHNTAGSFKARKNGNTSDDFSASSLNTRPGANPYANKITAGLNATLSAQQIDDFIWRSDASSVAWVGDIRGYARMPAGDVSTQWARAPTTVTASTGVFTTLAISTSVPSRYTLFSAAYDGTIATAILSLATGYTGNMKCSIFGSSGTGPTTVLGSATTINNPVTGNNTFTFPTPVAVVKGGQYYIGFCTDTSAGTWNITNASGSNGVSTSTPYASFPAANPTPTNAQIPTMSVLITVSTNTSLVNEAQQDGTTSYVYDATVNDADLYAIASIGGVPSNVVAVTTRGFFSKSDAGARGAQVQLKSGATTAGSTPTLLSNTFGWLWRTDVTDPATGSAWTGAAVDALTIGPRVTS